MIQNKTLKNGRCIMLKTIMQWTMHCNWNWICRS